MTITTDAVVRDGVSYILQLTTINKRPDATTRELIVLEANPWMSADRAAAVAAAYEGCEAVTCFMLARTIGYPVFSIPLGTLLIEGSDSASQILDHFRSLAETVALAGAVPK